MKCRCIDNKEMKFVWCWDDDQITDNCFNLYVCEDCGSILKDDVCKRKQIWIHTNNEIRH